uniref:Molybdenum cofactor sulfurase n=1 Tax=Denticeps clupeoides TaxID=299321 RepID=A0AAY4ERS7_9TELE
MASHCPDYKEIYRFDHFTELWEHYGYGGDMQELRLQEFGRVKGITYLDHAGTTLFPESQIKGFYQDIARNIYGNPHSLNPSSKLTHDTVERVRYRILEHFNTSPEEYTVIFTAGSTAALRLVADSFPWSPPAAEEPGSSFCYLTDNHTSVVGIRGAAAKLGATTLPVLPQHVETRARDAPWATGGDVCHLFCYPAQSNFSGRKYPLSYVKGIQGGRLYPACDRQGQWMVLLDAASFVSCSSLDLQECPADFIPISFYKIFGFPTGLGALLVRNRAAVLLRKGYFGGGTAAAYLAEEDYFVPASNVSSRFEDGTISFLDIISLHHGFDSLYRITGSMFKIQMHTFGLARYTYIHLSSLLHCNKQPVAQIYCENDFQDPSRQGAIINFNLLNSHGSVVGYSLVDRLASLFNIHVRTGCFCNTGACQIFLGISDQNIKHNLEAGHVCGDNIDLVDGRPTGSVRVSFGYMTTFEDCQNFLSFVVNCFVDKPLRMHEERLTHLKTADSSPRSPTSERHNAPDLTPSFTSNLNGEEGVIKNGQIKDSQTLTNIFIYPIKSCAAFEVVTYIRPYECEWPLGNRGLQYDRTWMVVNENGVCLSQKREPRLCLIQPSISLASNMLHIQAPGMMSISMPLEDPLEMKTSQSKVCGDRVQTVDCGDEVASWFSGFLGKPCHLIRQSPESTRDMKKGLGQGMTSLSLVNEAQYLLINRASVALLQECISSSGLGTFDALQLIKRFRANLVISGACPFEEDDWSNLKIGEMLFQVACRCARCHMICIDPETGSRTQEPLKSLTDFKKGKVTFGVYLLQRSMECSSATFMLSVGNSVHPDMPSI